MKNKNNIPFYSFPLMSETKKKWLHAASPNYESTERGSTVNVLNVLSEYDAVAAKSIKRMLFLYSFPQDFIISH